MALRLAAFFFAVLALVLFLTMALWAFADMPGQDPQTILGGYSQTTVTEFFAGLSMEQRKIWRAAVIYLDFPFIVCAGLAGYLTFAAAHGALRNVGMGFVWVFVFLDVLEDLQLLSQIEPYLAEGWVLYPPISDQNIWLGWVTSAKIIAFAMLLLGAIFAIWQKPKP